MLMIVLVRLPLNLMLTLLLKRPPKTLAEGGFNLNKFVNDKELLTEVSVECRAKEVRELGSQSECRVLGIKWMISSEFFFEV